MAEDFSFVTFFKRGTTIQNRRFSSHESNIHQVIVLLHPFFGKVEWKGMLYRESCCILKEMQPIRKFSTFKPESLHKGQSSQNSRKIALPQRTAGPAGTGNQGIRSQNYPDRQGQIDLLLLKLSGNTLLSGHKGLSSLRGLLTLLRDSYPAPGSSDSLLAVKYLENWIRKYSQDIPLKIVREIRQTAQHLQRESQEIRNFREDSGFLYSLDGAYAEEEGRHSWTLSVNRERKGAGSDPDENIPFCILSFDSFELGPLRAVLHYDGKRSRIAFYSSKWQTRHLLRRALTGFRSRLFKSGFQSCELLVGRHKLNKQDFPTRQKPEGRIGLWG